MWSRVIVNSTISYREIYIDAIFPEVNEVEHTSTPFLLGVLQ